jgi:hypothetical protein
LSKNAEIVRLQLGITLFAELATTMPVQGSAGFRLPAPALEPDVEGETSMEVACKDSGWIQATIYSMNFPARANRLIG